MLPLQAAHEDQACSILPREVWQYFAAGAGDEVTLAASPAAWRQYQLRPRVLRDVSAVDTSTRLLGAELASPVLVAPFAFHGLLHDDAERATVAGAGDAGCLAVVSTRASRRLEEVAEAATGPWWFQVYAMRDRALTEQLVRRAARAGAAALVLTVDTPYVGRKRAVSGTRIAVSDDHFLVNLASHLVPGALAREAAEQDPSLTPDAIGWLADLSGLPVLVKGVLRADEAQRCVDAGAAGVVVSNHGGRQLDRTVPSALALPEVVAAVADRVPVLVDGGLRDGADVLVALALGASGVLLGRPVAWALAAAGRAGVRDVLAEVREDLRDVMALAGAHRVAAVDASLVRGPRAGG